MRFSQGDLVRIDYDDGEHDPIVYIVKECYQFSDSYMLESPSGDTRYMNEQFLVPYVAPNSYGNYERKCTCDGYDLFWYGCKCGGK